MAKKILVVDDEPDLLDVVTVRLRHSGYEIMGAIDAEEALELLQKNIPDLILLDLLLPKMQGDELCRKLKADSKFKHIPIILFTASVIRPSSTKDIQAMGADDCIIKPFQPEDLIAKIEKYIR